MLLEKMDPCKVHNKEREVITVNEAEILKRSRKQAERLWKGMADSQG